MNPQDQPSLLERLEELGQESTALSEDLRQRQTAVESEVAKYLPPTDVTVRVALADNGFLEHLEITGRPGTNPRATLQAINGAILLTQAQKAAMPLEAARATIDAISSGITDDEVRVSDDFGTLTVTALYGDIRGVHAADRWLASSSNAVIEEEILRIAQDAARRSDVYRRFAGEDHG